MHAYGMPRSFYRQPSKEEDGIWDDMRIYVRKDERQFKRRARREGRKACQERDE